MSDEVDDLLRRAMATLDRRVPRGYFDALPDRVSARLDAPEVGEGEAAMAPDGDELARERARRGAAVAATAAMVPAPPASPAPEPVPPRASRGRHVAVGAAFGLSVAAAVGVMIFISIAGQRGAPAPVGRAPGSDAVATGTGAAPEAPPGAAAPGAWGRIEAGPPPSGDPPVSSAGASPDKPPSDAKPRPAGKTAPAGKPTGKPSVGPPTSGDGTGGKRAGKLSKKGEPDAGGGGDAIASALSPEDFQRGMDAVAARARACSASTKVVAQGTASLQVSVAPSGKVSRVVVSGVFAGTPVAACIERAVASATFPAWDGKPQRFAHSYLFSE